MAIEGHSYDKHLQKFDLLAFLSCGITRARTYSKKAQVKHVPWVREKRVSMLELVPGTIELCE